MQETVKRIEFPFNSMVIRILSQEIQPLISFNSVVIWIIRYEIIGPSFNIMETIWLEI